MEEVKRLTRLEMRLTEHDATIDDLNRIVTEQWRLIDRLTRQMSAMQEQVETLAERAGPRAPEPPPPHY